MEYAAKHFPGHQALVATHPDGHNHSDNIHVHIVINSLRVENVPTLPYMDRPADTKAGCKHRAAVLAALEQNAVRATEKPAPVPEHRPAAKEHPQGAYVPKQDGIQRIVDREAAREKGFGYDRWASVHNLKQMAKTHNFLTDNDMLDLAKLDEAIVNANAELQDATAALKDCEKRLKQKTDLRTAAINYRSTKPVVDKLKTLKPRQQEKYRQDNERDFIIFEAAKRQLAAMLPGKKLPTKQAIQAEVEALIS